MADAIVQHDIGENAGELVRVAHPLNTIRGSASPLATLAETMAASVIKHGYNSRDSILSCIDACLLASFEHIGEPIDIERELVTVNPPEPDIDKFPDWLPALPPRVKCMVGKHCKRITVSPRQTGANPSIRP